MTGWLIFGGICLCIPLIVFIPLTVHIKVYEDALAYLNILFFRIPIYPKKQKHPNPRDFTAKALKKRRKKLLSKRKKPQVKQDKTTKKQPEENEDSSALLRLVLHLFREKYCVIGIEELTVRICADDAAKTAIAYGTVSAALNTLLVTLMRIGMIRKNAKKHIRLIAGFDGGEFSFSCHITIKTNVLRVIQLLVKDESLYLGESAKDKKNETEEEKKKRLDNEARARAEILRDIGK